MATAVAVPHIGLKALQYTGGVEKRPDGKRFLNLTGSAAIYVGEPSPEIEKNWEDLESGASLLQTSQAALTRRSDLGGFDRGREHAQGRYADQDNAGAGPAWDVSSEVCEGSQVTQAKLTDCGSLDVIHSLHCVNQLRKAVYADHYYPLPKRTEFYFTHMSTRSSFSRLRRKYLLLKLPLTMVLH